MRKVLFLNHKIKECGVQQFGRRVYDIAKFSLHVNYLYFEIDSPYEYNEIVNWCNPDVIIYNWHRGTMPWLTGDMVSSRKNIKHYFIYHEEVTREFYDKYLFFGDYDFSGGSKFGDKKLLLPRPLLIYSGNYPKNETLTIGSFGFGFWNKGYHTLTKLVNDTFDKANLKFHMPFSHFGDPLKEQTNAVAAECRKLVTKPGINLSISHEFVDDGGILTFLAGNDINVFLYEENGEGISSVIDYALSVKRPIGISRCKMFRHIFDEDIILDNKSIIEIISNGTEPLDKFYTSWNPTRFLEELDKEFI